MSGDRIFLVHRAPGNEIFHWAAGNRVTLRVTQLRITLTYPESGAFVQNLEQTAYYYSSSRVFNFLLKTFQAKYSIIASRHVGESKRPSCNGTGMLQISHRAIF